MPTSFRVKDDDKKIVEWVTWGKQHYAIAMVGKTCRVYEDGSYYSSTSGGVGARGKVMRGLDGKPLKFVSPQAAEEWVKSGCLLVDRQGNEL